MDIGILCLAGAGLIKGLFDGIIRQVVALAALVIGIYLCTGAADWLCGYLRQLDWFPQQAVFPTSYFLGFVLIVGIILLAGHVIHQLISATPLSIFNHITGGVLGFALMVLFMSFLLNMIEKIDPDSVILSQEVKVESRFYYTVKTIIPTVFPGNLFRLTVDIVE